MSSGHSRTRARATRRRPAPRRSPRRSSRRSGPRFGRLLALVAVAGTVVAIGWALSDSWRRAIPIVEVCEAAAGDFVATLTPDQAENAALIAAASVRREMPARAATIALATAFQESNLYNIDYGDRDSVGLFQQRPSQGWGTEDQIMNPYYAANAFYDRLAEVPDYTSMEITDAAQAVQISAFGEAYAQHEPRARALASTLTGHSPAGFTCTVDPDHAGAGTGARVADEMARAFASRAPAEVTDDGLAVTVPDRSTGWAVAHWAVAHARRFGLEEISHAGRAWSLEASADGWRQRPTASADTVRIRLLR